MPKHMFCFRFDGASMRRAGNATPHSSMELHREVGEVLNAAEFSGARVHANYDSSQYRFVDIVADDGEIAMKFKLVLPSFDGLLREFSF
ncbi:hypothetical protein [Azospirillum brasilense]|uniref:hypothetical protein n=1 Tax=Azospirillum brasilense TaxID=192 RepID=UPI0010C035B7|nr:hypothetical protein [Azospirillum brasilense]